tara:strand:+ start:661 stop:978 length:318 start_codon:yes stop_codon:yes gene_type:complete
MILAELQPHSDEFEFEDFTFEIDDYFSKYLNKEVFVEGKNLTWRNLTGTKTFTLVDVNQIWRELAPYNTDFSFIIEDTDKENVYQAKCSHHDSPTGESFKITFNQ